METDVFVLLFVGRRKSLYKMFTQTSTKIGNAIKEDYIHVNEIYTSKTCKDVHKLNEICTEKRFTNATKVLPFATLAFLKAWYVRV